MKKYSRRGVSDLPGDTPRMEYSEIFFGKPDLKLIDEDDLQKGIIARLQNGSLESSSIEFKSYEGITSLKTKIPEITRNMVALANSANRGGMLILGIDEKGIELTPFSIDVKKYDKDAIYQSIEAQLLNEKRETFEVHLIHSKLRKGSYYVLVEIVVKENSPYYWGYVPKREYYPFVRKTEKGVVNLSPSEIHLPQGYDLQIVYPVDTFQIRNHPERESIGELTSYLIPIPITIKNVGIHSVKNVQVKLYIFCRYLTENDRLVYVFQDESLHQKELQRQKLNEYVQNQLKLPLSARYLQKYDGNLGNTVEITINEKFELAQGQTIEIQFPILAYVGNIRRGSTPFEIHITSNELGLQEYPITLYFVKYPE